VVTHAEGQPLSLAKPHPAASATPELHEQFLELLRMNSK
jgi:hypothetical protein